MSKRYLVDTCIWIDLYEDRVGYNGEPLGEYAWQFVKKIKAADDRVVVTNFGLKELERRCTLEQINGLFAMLRIPIDTVSVDKKQWNEASLLSQERNLSRGDAIHAIVARDNALTLVTRDNHFKLLTDISIFYKPEELI